MERCLILTGGKLSLAFAGSFLKEHKFEKVVAVDGGLEAAKELDIIPDVIVGDFDTVHPEILAYYRKMEHIVWEVHQPEKDDTDTELAIKRALPFGRYAPRRSDTDGSGSLRSLHKYLFAGTETADGYFRPYDLTFLL